MTIRQDEILLRGVNEAQLSGADLRIPLGCIVCLSGSLGSGVEVLAHRGADRLLVSGVAREVRPEDLAAELRIDERVFACCIDLGKFAEDTRGNGAEIANWAGQRGYDSLRVVTAADHMRRALVEIRLRLPESVELVADAVPPTGNTLSYALEYSKLLARLGQSAVGGAA